MEKEKMKINDLVVYRDGGTILINTNYGDYSIDDRLFSKTKHKLYAGYPEDNNSNLITKDAKLKKELLDAVVVYGGIYCDRIIDILKEKE